MIIGSGLIAKGLIGIELLHPDILFFASGVSNSNETDERQFEREEMLLVDVIKMNPEKTVVYFSTYSLEDPNRRANRYVLHKNKMEKIVESTNNYLIFRLTNLIGVGGNDKNLINFFMRAISKGEEIHIWKNVKRNIVGIDDLIEVISSILKRQTLNETLLLAHPYSFTIEEIVSSISEFTGIKASLKSFDKGEYDNYETNKVVNKAFSELNTVSKKFYLQDLLSRYYKS